MSKLLMAPAALAVGLSLAGASFAQPAASDPPRQVVVKDGDLNLANAAGVEVLRGRIHFAALQVCGPEPDNRNLADSTSFRQCVGRAQAQAASMVAEAKVGTRLAAAR
jgi:UrcA family protein